MSVPQFILDGTAPHGTMGTITINTVAYIVEDEKVTPNWSEASDRKADGSPNRKRWTRDRYKLELKLQLAASNTAYPPPGSTFTYAPKNIGNAITFVVINTPEERSNEESQIETATISCEEVVNSITTA